MIRLPAFVAMVGILLSLSLRDSYAGPYDGEWTGSATATRGRCRPAAVSVTVTGTVVTGEAKFELEVQKINGTVREDGTFGATLGFNHLTGKFTGDQFEGTFTRSDCAWQMQLRRR